MAFRTAQNTQSRRNLNAPHEAKPTFGTQWAANTEADAQPDQSLNSAPQKSPLHRGPRGSRVGLAGYSQMAVPDATSENVL